MKEKKKKKKKKNYSNYRAAVNNNNTRDAIKKETHTHRSVRDELRRGEERFREPQEWQERRKNSRRHRHERGVRHNVSSIF
jgi:hypothetical protein